MLCYNIGIGLLLLDIKIKRVITRLSFSIFLFVEIEEIWFR